MARAKKKKETDVLEEIAQIIEAPEETVADEAVAEEVVAEETAAEENFTLEPTTEETAVEASGEGEEPADLAISVDDVRLVEAILFASSSAVSVSQIAERFPADRVSLIPDILEHLREQYAARGVTLVQRDSRWALRTAVDLGDQLRLEKEQPKKFTRAAMETMAIIAYHQPVTRAEIENIRGVATSPGALDALMEAGWIKPGKRREVPGRPVTWLSTQAFLDHFGLEKIEDLPGMDELKAAGLLDKRPAVEAMPTADLFGDSENVQEVDPNEVTDEDLIGNSGVAEDEVSDKTETEASSEESVSEESEDDISENDNEDEQSDDGDFGGDDDEDDEDEDSEDEDDSDEDGDDEEEDDEDSDDEDESDEDDEDYGDDDEDEDYDEEDDEGSDEDDEDESDDEDEDDEDSEDEDKDNK